MVFGSFLRVFAIPDQKTIMLWDISDLKPSASAIEKIYYPLKHITAWNLPGRALSEPTSLQIVFEKIYLKKDVSPTLTACYTSAFLINTTI